MPEELKEAKINNHFLCSRKTQSGNSQDFRGWKRGEKTKRIFDKLDTGVAKAFASCIPAACMLALLLI